MMRQLSILFLLLLTSAGAFAQFDRFPGTISNNDPERGRYNPFSEGVDTLDNETADTSSQIIYQNTDTIDFRKVVREFDLNLERSIPRFSLDDVHEYQAAQRTEEYSWNLGNNGLPIMPLTYTPTYRTGIDFGLNNYDAYLKQTNDVKYYIAQRPFTKLFYVTGSERENNFSIEHTQNWGRGLNIGASYESLVSDGFYDNQKIDHKNIDAHAWYQSKNKKFNSLFQYINNKYLVGANGGIKVDENVYENDDFNQRQSIPVAMQTAAKRFKGNEFNLQNSYDLGQSFKVKINDSISDLQLVPRFRFQHTVNYSTQEHQFRSDVLETTYFRNTYIDDSLTTKDRFDTERLFTEFRLKWLGNKLVDSTLQRQNFLADAYANFSTYDIKMLNDFNKKPTDAVVGGSFRSNPLDSAKILYKAEGEFHFLDYRQGDYFVRGEAGFDLNNAAGNLLAYIELSNQEQPYTSQFFYQSHYQLTNDFPKQNARTIGGEYYNPFLKGSVQARLVNASNILYYNNNRQPTIDSDAESYVMVKASKQFSVKNFNLDAAGIYQTSTDNQTINVPEWIAYGDVYYKGPLFKNNVIGKIGLNAQWTSANNFRDYDASLDQFFNQDEFTYNNNAQIGFYSNFSLSRARVFLRLDHLGSFLVENPIMHGHNYPQHDFAFRAGINWVFVN